MDRMMSPLALDRRADAQAQTVPPQPASDPGTPPEPAPAPIDDPTEPEPPRVEPDPGGSEPKPTPPPMIA